MNTEDFDIATVNKEIHICWLWICILSDFSNRVNLALYKGNQHFLFRNNTRVSTLSLVSRKNKGSIEAAM